MQPRALDFRGHRAQAPLHSGQAWLEHRNAELCQGQPFPPPHTGTGPQVQGTSLRRDPVRPIISGCTLAAPFQIPLTVPFQRVCGGALPQ